MDGQTTNAALPALFIEIFPAWLAALVGVAVLAAIMSTADGLVVAASQTIANDIYRRSIVPRFASKLTDEEVDHRVLKISRWSTVGILILCMLMAWALMDTNITLLVLMGSGGMMAAFAGPLVLGALWRGVTRHGALRGSSVAWERSSSCTRARSIRPGSARCRRSSNGSTAKRTIPSRALRSVRASGCS